jgi:hypothetical protein
MTDDMILFYFESIIPRLGRRAESKNPLACVLMVYITFVVPDIKAYAFDRAKFDGILLDLASRAEFLFADYGLRRQDLVRYVRFFETQFSVKE